MAEDSKIEWCDHTANFWWGCHKVSAGCANCYADTLAKRWGKNIWGPAKTTDREYKKAVWKEVVKWNEKANAEGVRRRVFTLSMGDFFEDHPQVVEWRNEAMRLMAELDALDWLVLTKRPENVLGMVPYTWLSDWPAHVWIGTSVENQEQADKRIPELLKFPAAVRFLSMEPLLGEVNLHPWVCEYGDAGKPEQKMTFICKPSKVIDWVIVGGESGHGARPMNPDWVRSIRDQCQEANVSFFFKQWGEWVPAGKRIFDNKQMVIFGQEVMYKVGKSAAGRLLDGREWNEIPTTPHASFFAQFGSGSELQGQNGQ